MPKSTPERPWLQWYGKKRWVVRAREQMREQPLCEMCLAEGTVRAAKVADHVVPHRGDPQLFWFGKLQSLCGPHHSSSKQQIEQRGYVRDIGGDGWPVDENHPVYR